MNRDVKTERLSQLVNEAKEKIISHKTLNIFVLGFLQVVQQNVGT